MAGFFGFGRDKSGKPVPKTNPSTRASTSRALPALSGPTSSKSTKKPHPDQDMGWNGSRLSVEPVAFEKKLAKSHRQLDSIKKRIDSPGGAEDMAQRIRVMMAMTPDTRGKR